MDRKFRCGAYSTKSRLWWNYAFQFAILLQIFKQIVYQSQMLSPFLSNWVLYQFLVFVGLLLDRFAKDCSVERNSVAYMTGHIINWILCHFFKPLDDFNIRFFRRDHLHNSGHHYRTNLSKWLQTHAKVYRILTIILNMACRLSWWLPTLLLLQSLIYHSSLSD